MLLEPMYLGIMVGSLLVMVAIFTSILSFRFGAPLLLVFLLLGLFAGEDGPGGIAFDLLPPLLVSSGPLYHVLQVTVHGATPGSTVRIVDDSIGRYRQMIATFCPSTPAPAASTLLGSTIADSAGNASILLRLPVSAPGTSTDLLAVEVNSCAHDIEVFTHP